MKREDQAVAVALGAVGLLLLSSRSSASAPRVSTPKPKPAAKPVRGNVEIGEPSLIINGQRVDPNDKAAIARARAKKTAAAKPAAKKTTAKKPTAPKPAPKAAPQGVVEMGEPTMIINGQAVPLADKRAPAAPEDANTRELKTKIAALSKKRFGAGDHWQELFDVYDADGDGMIPPDAVAQLLLDANVGNVLTRGEWVKGIFARFDTDESGAISFAEFLAGIRQNSPAAPKATGSSSASSSMSKAKTPGFGVLPADQAQQLLNRLGAKVTSGGIFTPSLAYAWKTYAGKLKQDPTCDKYNDRACVIATKTLAAFDKAAQSRTPAAEVPDVRIIPSNKPRSMASYLTPSQGLLAVNPGLSQEEYILAAQQIHDADISDRELDTTRLSERELEAFEGAMRMTDKQRSNSLANAMRATRLARNADGTERAPKDDDLDVMLYPAREPRSGDIYQDEEAPTEHADQHATHGNDPHASDRASDNPAAPAAPINLERARTKAPTIAKMIKAKKAKYDRDQLRSFQRDAGLVSDGSYGPTTAGALRYFGVPNPPAPLEQGKTIRTYYPPPDRR